jgi:Flp pilus assembly pilin Flp
LSFVAGDANLYRYVFNQPLRFTDPSGEVTAIEYAVLATALARPGTFCRFAVCVANLWGGVANSVANLVPMGTPDAT